MILGFLYLTARHCLTKFVLLSQNTRDWVIYTGQKFLKVLIAEKPKIKTPAVLVIWWGPSLLFQDGALLLHPDCCALRESEPSEDSFKRTSFMREEPLYPNHLLKAWPLNSTTLILKGVHSIYMNTKNQIERFVCASGDGQVPALCWMIGAKLGFFNRKSVSLWGFFSLVLVTFSKD